jgi:chromosome segregation ATPase
MDNNRFVQILQEISVYQNSFIYSLNNYINEVQTSVSNQYDFSYVQNLQSENNNLTSRVNELTTNINQMQNELLNLQSQISNNNYNSSSELDSLRMLVNSLTTDKDYLQSQLNSKDTQINELINNNLTLQLTNDSNVSNINDLNNTIAQINVKLNEAYTVIGEKQAEYDVLVQRNNSFREVVEQLKVKVADELDEAQRDIDQALEEASK